MLLECIVGLVLDSKDKKKRAGRQLYVYLLFCYRYDEIIKTARLSRTAFLRSGAINLAHEVC